MTPKEHLDNLTNIEYDNKLTVDAFLYMADGGMYPYKMEDLAIAAAEAYAKQETEKYIMALTAIANHGNEERIADDEVVTKMKHIARRVLNLD